MDFMYFRDTQKSYLLSIASDKIRFWNIAITKQKKT